MERCCYESDSLPTIEQARAFDTTVERVPCQEISRQDFAKRYEEARKPVILTGCAEAWPARERWSSLPNLMRHIPAESKWKVTFDPLQDKWKVATWREIREMYEGGSFFYIFDQLRDAIARQTITRDYDEPLQFRNVDLYKDLTDFPPNYGPRRWFVAGVKDSGTDPHLDPSGTDAWNTAVLGNKWWVLFEPGIEVEDVTCDPSCSDRMMVRDWYASMASKPENSTSAKKIIHVFQEPGETLYLPYGYVHAVYNLADCIGVTANYAAPHEANRFDIWRAVTVEGTVEHKRSFFWGKLTSNQRKVLRMEARDDVSNQLELPGILLDGLEQVEDSYKRNPRITMMLLTLLFVGTIGAFWKALQLLSSPPPSGSTTTQSTAGKTIRVKKVTRKVDATRQKKYD